jgi:hypothetical protein
MKVRTATLVRLPADWSFPVAIFTGLVLILFLLVWSQAWAQNPYPRVGLSASPDFYLDTIEVMPGEEFTLYACVFGPYPGEPVAQPFTSLSWVIHQVCCGAVVNILDYQFNPELENSGHPLLGVQTQAENCYDQDSILLATMTCTLANPTPGGVLWAGGPFDASYDCEGGNALFMGLAVTIQVPDDVLPVDDTRWGSIKALYH